MSNKAAHYLQSLRPYPPPGPVRDVEYLILLCEEETRSRSKSTNGQGQGVGAERSAMKWSSADKPDGPCAKRSPQGPRFRKGGYAAYRPIQFFDPDGS